MEAGDYLEAVRAAMSAHGFEQGLTFVGGRPAVAGRRSDFRWRWFASRLYTALVVAQFGPEEADRASLDQFLQASILWAADYGPGRKFGPQTGIAAVAVAVFDGLTPEARAWASEPHGRRYAVVTLPVAVDLRAGLVVQPRKVVIGRIFMPFLRGLVNEIIAGQLRSRG